MNRKIWKWHNDPLDSYTQRKLLITYVVQNSCYRSSSALSLVDNELFFALQDRDARALLLRFSSEELKGVL
jgi:hypothetical protein